MGPGEGMRSATSLTTDPEHGLALNFLTDSSGGYLKVAPRGIDMRGFNVPVAGISLDSKMYVVVKTNHSRTEPTDQSVLTLFDEPRGSFTPVRTISRLPAGKVVIMSMREPPVPFPGLPPGGPHVLIWSSAVYRASNAYLSVVPKAQFESGRDTTYFAGLGPAGGPLWSAKEEDAKPIVEHPTIGDLSVTWAPSLRLFLMVYDSREPRGIVFRYARTPWGPWSEAQMIFTPAMEARDPFIHRPGRGDRLAGPVFAAGRPDPESVPGGAYAPYVIERFTRQDGDTLTLYYVLSTWNPYVVVLMRSSFRITGAER